MKTVCLPRRLNSHNSWFLGFVFINSHNWNCRLLCQVDSCFLFQASSGIFHLVCLYSGCDTCGSLVVLFLDRPLGYSRASIPGNHSHSHYHHSLRQRECWNAARQLHQGSRLLPVGQLCVYIYVICGVCDSIEYSSWSKVVSVPETKHLLHKKIREGK